MVCPTEVKAFVAEAPLATVATSPRISGSRDLIGFIVSFDVASSLYDPYFQGILFPALLIVVIYFAWLVALCTVHVGCCCTACNTTSWTGLAVFLALAVGSIVGWLIALAGDAEIITGIAGVGQAVQCTFDVIEDGLAEVVNITSLVVETDATLETTRSSCHGALNASLGANFTSSSSSTLTGYASPFLGTVEVFLRDLLGLEEDVDFIVDILNDYFLIYASINSAICGLLVLFMILFALSTTFGVVDGIHKIERKDTHCVAGISCMVRTFSTFVAFTCGIFVVSLVVLNLAVFTIILYLGADACYPSPTINFQDVLTGLVQNNKIALQDLPFQITGSVETSICQVQPFDLICYYEECQDPSPLIDRFNTLVADVKDIIVIESSVIVQNANDYLTDVEQTIDELSNNLTLQGVFCNSSTGLAVCNSSLCASSCNEGEGDRCPLNSTEGMSCHSLQDQTEIRSSLDTCLEFSQELLVEIETVEAMVLEVFQLLECEHLTPLYQMIVEQEFCNNIISGASLHYISMCLAVIGFMGALLVFRMMDFEPHPYPHQQQLTIKSKDSMTAML